MKTLLTKAVGRFAEDFSVGRVHLVGPIDTTACGLAREDYESKRTSKPIDCPTCITYLEWAKKVAKIKS